MENTRPTLAQYYVEQVCPDNKFLDEMDKVMRMRKNPKIDMRERELRKQLIPANFGGCLVAGVKRVPDCLRNPATLCRQSAFQVRP